jgi:hypothetical protein
MDMFRDVEAINAWLDESNDESPHEDSMRVMKIGEEYGEAVAAYIGMTGQNPRKRVTHTEDDLLKEIADVVVTGLCAIQHFTGSREVTRAIVAEKLAYIIRRAGIAVPPEPIDSMPWLPPLPGVHVRSDFRGM